MKHIAEDCDMKQHTVSNTICRLRTSNLKSVQKKIRGKLKLSERGTGLLHKYSMNHILDRLYTIAARFYELTGLNSSARTVRRYMRKLKMDC